MSNDRRAAATARRLDQIEAGTRRSASDPYLAGAFGRLRFEETGPREEVGVVVDAMPAAHCYLVSAGRNSYLWCSIAGSGAGFGVLGSRPLTTVTIGAVVYFIRHPDMPGYGQIRGVDPHWSSHTANQPSDAIWPFTRSGQFVETAHQYPQLHATNIGTAGTVNLGSVEGADFSAGRPTDNTTAGEWGAITETGVGVFMDSFHAFLRVDEYTGVFAFYADQMLRVSGHNYQQFSTVNTLERLEDEGELIGFSAACIYPWEPLGLWRFNQVTPGWNDPATPNHGLAPGQGVSFKDPYAAMAGSGDAVREPEDPAQIAAARLFTWEGYLGQGGKTLVAAPAQLGWVYPNIPMEGTFAAEVAAVKLDDAPADRMSVNGYLAPGEIEEGEEGEEGEGEGEGEGEIEEEGFKRPTTTAAAEGGLFAIPANIRGGPDQPGLFEQNVSLTGALHIRSARRVLISKRVSIPNPKPIVRPEDPAGDSYDSGYVASGLNPAAPPNPDGSYTGGMPPAHRVSAELRADNIVPYRAVLLPDTIAYAFNWEGLHPFFYHEKDWSVAEEGDAGSKAVNQDTPAYATLALQQYLKEPSVVFLDIDHRYGFAPYYESESGLALLDDGSVVVYDGWGSEIVMAGGSIDLRCAGDIRLLPGRNVVAWAGHDFNVKAHDTVDVSAVNGDMFLRSENKFHALSGNSGLGGFLFENKAICPAFNFTDKIGADSISSGFTVICPDSNILLRAQDIAVQLMNTSTDGRIYLDAGPARPVFTRGKTITSRVDPDGAILHLFAATAGSKVNEFTATYAMIGGDLMVNGGGFYKSTLSTAQGLSTGLTVTQNHSATLNPIATSVTNRHTSLVNTYMKDFDDQVLLPPRADGAEFTHRTMVQYRTSDFVYWESRWQTIADSSNQALWSWSEPSVIGLVSEVETHSYPGERRLESDSYAYVIPLLVDTVNGWVAVDRTANLSDYMEAEVNETTLTDVDSALKVTVPYGDE